MVMVKIIAIMFSIFMIIGFLYGGLNIIRLIYERIKKKPFETSWFFMFDDMDYRGEIITSVCLLIPFFNIISVSILILFIFLQILNCF